MVRINTVHFARAWYLMRENEREEKKLLSELKPKAQI